MGRGLRRRAVAAMVVGGLVGGVVGGCSDESDGDVVATPVTPASPTPTPSTTSTPSPTEPSGSDSPDPVEPSLPAAAEGDSVRSAKAFVRHYIELLNYAMTTGDTGRLREAADGCGGCDAYAELYEDDYADGGYYRGRVGHSRVSLWSAAADSGLRSWTCTPRGSST